MLITFKDGHWKRLWDLTQGIITNDLERLAFVYDETGNRVLDISIHGDV